MDEATRLRDYMLREKEEPEKTKEAALDYLKTLPLPNKEWLATIPTEEAYETLKWLVNTYSQVGNIKEWLDEQHYRDDMPGPYNPGIDRRWTKLRDWRTRSAPTPKNSKIKMSS